jgi:hypothetical protein
MVNDLVNAENEWVVNITFGMAVWPLKRRLTLLSIPFGFRHASFTL